MSFLSDIGTTIFGGSKSDQHSSGTNSSVSSSGDYAYPFLASLLGPSVQSASGGTNQLASLLGLPGFTPTSAPSIPTGTPSAQPPAGPNLTGAHYVDLFHDGINGNGKSAQKSGQPTAYWAGADGRPINMNGGASPAPAGGPVSGGMAPLAAALGGTSVAGRRLANSDPVLAPLASLAAPALSSTVIDNGMGPAIKPGSTVAPTPVASPTAAVPAVPATPAPAPAPASTSPQLSALNTFANSAGLKFLQDQGNNMINSNQAAKGLLNSGSTLKAVQDYGNNLNSTYLNQYLDHVLDLSKVGVGLASVLSDAGRYSSGNSTGISSSSGSSLSKPGLLTPNSSGGSQLGSLMAAMA